MNEQMKTIEAVDISTAALEAMQQMCECAELVHHFDVNRANIIEKLAAVDRELANQCYDDVVRILSERKTVRNG